MYIKANINQEKSTKPNCITSKLKFTMSFNKHLCKGVVVVVVVYLTTNQRHMGYLSSSNGHMAGRYSTP